MINIVSYQLNFDSFAYRLKIRGKYEIESRFTIPTKTLIGKMRFPNQDISAVELVPARENCKTTTKDKCQVFVSESFLNLSGDKYFSREIKKEESVPTSISFEFNTDNLGLFLKINKLNRNYNRTHLDLITDIKKLRISADFLYKNTFEINKHKYDEDDYRIDVPYKWTIENGRLDRETRNLEVNLKNYSDLLNKGIKNWFSIGHRKENNRHLALNINQEENRVEIRDKDGHQEIDIGELDYHSESGFTTYRFRGGLERYSDGWKLNKRKNITYFPIETEGRLRSRLRIVLDKVGFGLNINTHFNFLNNQIFTQGNGKKPILKILNKSFEIPKNLWKYKSFYVSGNQIQRTKADKNSAHGIYSQRLINRSDI